jgi:hypothetical protein
VGERRKLDGTGEAHSCLTPTVQQVEGGLEAILSSQLVLSIKCVVSKLELKLFVVF